MTSTVATASEDASDGGGGGGGGGGYVPIIDLTPLREGGADGKRAVAREVKR